MQIVVATRNGELSERQREMVREQFARLSRFESRVSRIEVTLSEQKNRWEVEALASIDRAEPVHAHAEHGDVRGAVDRAVDRMGRQLRKLRSRHVDHQGPSRGSTVRSGEEE